MSLNEEQEGKKQKIQRWLMEDGYKVQEMPDTNAVFRFQIENRAGLKVDVFQPINTDDKVAVISGFSLTPDQKNKLAAMNGKERLEVLWDIRFGLLNLKVGFEKVDFPLDVIQVVHVVYYDGINKNVFMYGVFNIYNALVYILNILNKRFGEPVTKVDLGYIG